MKMQEGFTLVELMVVVVVLAILASVGMPLYSDYMTRGKLLEATAGLSDGRIKMEQFYQDHLVFDNSRGGTPPLPPATPNFSFSFTAQSPTAYTIKATGQGNLAAYSYSIDQSNAKKSTTPYSGGVEVACWIMKKGDGC